MPRRVVTREVPGVGYLILTSGAAFELLERITPDWNAFNDSVLTISPVAIRITWTALPITSAGRFSPFGPRGMA
jgi:hypothetical protein